MEYWLIDARGEEIQFDILQYTDDGYVATRPRSGWLKSAIFGKSFRFVREKDALGHPDFTLELR